MIKLITRQIDQKLSPARQKYTALQQGFQSLSNRLITAPPVRLPQKEIQDYKITKQTVEERSTLLQTTKSTISEAVYQDSSAIRNLSTLVANEIIFKCFPEQYLNPIFADNFYLYGKVDPKSHAEKLLQTKDTSSFSLTQMDQYIERKKLFRKLSDSLESFLTTSLLSPEDGLLFKDVQKLLSDRDGNSLSLLKEAKTKYPSGLLLLSIQYKEGRLEAKLTNPMDRENRQDIKPLVVSIPHIQPIADEVRLHSQRHESLKEYHNNLYAKMFGLYNKAVEILKSLS
ncbi:MAG: hypothetical protein JSS09_01785 [Verrucomicrobia bacterium]|nr:hypothetical protein [Verrucomicrobiota bacterium]